MHPGHVVEFDHLMSLVEQNYVDRSHITGSEKVKIQQASAKSCYK